MEPYEHKVTVPGLVHPWLAVAVFVGGLVAAGFLRNGAVAAVGPAVLLVNDVFRTFKTRVTATEVSWEFKFGVLADVIPLADVAGAEQDGKRISLWSWVGCEAVVLKLRGGKTALIGTDEPNALIAAIARFRGA